VLLSGRATVAGAAELKALLLTAIAAADEIVLDVSAITECDPTFFQLICASHRSATAAGKQVSIAPESGNNLWQLADTAGFHPQNGCGQTANSCPLFKEEAI